VIDVLSADADMIFKDLGEDHFILLSELNAICRLGT